MKIKKYTGSTMQEVMVKVKMDLGKDALIINTRNLRGRGLLKFFRKPGVEVIAAIDEDNFTQKGTHTPSSFKENLSVQKTAAQKTNNQIKIDMLESKFNNMEETLKNIYSHVQKISYEAKENKEEDSSQQSKNSIAQLFYNNLLKNEVDSGIADKLISQVCSKLGDNSGVNNFITALYNEISELLGKPVTIAMEQKDKPHVVIFAGPTGVGKTTTIAKLAAHYFLNCNKKVSVITADTYRIAAVEQLKVYTDILGIPLSTVHSVNEVRTTIDSYQDMDLILIDTAGRSYKDTDSFEEIKQIINAAQADEVYIVLSMTMSTRNCKEVLANYDFLNDYKLIFTKYDETSAPGIILNILDYARKHLSYITTGQSVPDDIEVCDTDKIIKKVIGNIS